MNQDAVPEIRKERFEFPNDAGERLAGLLERPASEIAACAIFAHCFTCSKDIAAASRIPRALAVQGIAVVRFDFTGLGHSQGEFANTNFSSNVADLPGTFTRKSTICVPASPRAMAAKTAGRLPTSCRWRHSAPARR